MLQYKTGNVRKRAALASSTASPNRPIGRCTRRRSFFSGVLRKSIKRADGMKFSHATRYLFGKSLRVLRGPLQGYEFVRTTTKGQSLKVRTGRESSAVCPHGHAPLLTLWSSPARLPITGKSELLGKVLVRLPLRQYLIVFSSSVSLSYITVVRNSHASCGVAAPMRATKLAVLIILPPVCRPFSLSTGLFLIARIAYLQPHQTPLRLICIVRSQIFSSVFSALSSAGCMIPALLNCLPVNHKHYPHKIRHPP